MHFWIDKRSPQCGFGRSRVAASLHTGGSGLSFGHPPRRSGGHKSSSSSTVNSAISATSNTGIQVHRQQHHHQQQQPQQASTAQCHTHVALTSNNAQYRATNYPSGSSSNTTTNNNNNSNNAANHGANRNFVRSSATASQHYHNNNRQQQQQSVNCGLPNSSNNNHSNLSGTTQSLVSPTSNNLSTSLNNATIVNSTNTSGTHQHAQRYRHPQFGNMSVRTYQPSTATTGAALTQQQQSQIQLQPSTTNITTTTTTTTTNTIPINSVATATAATTNQLQRLDESLITSNEHRIHHSPNQTANCTVELYQQQTSPRIVNTFNRNLTATTMSPVICDYNNIPSNLGTTYTNSTLPSTTTTTNRQYHHHQHQQQRFRQRGYNPYLDPNASQHLPVEYKCSTIVSTLLVTLFFIGFKLIYFDNCGTQFEAGIFWLLTVTSGFAYFFVSKWKSRSNSSDQMDEAGGRGSMVNSIEDTVITGLHELQQEQIQSININAQAGPPPYHIAILLPDTKAKEDITTLEESPPPSYDKILI